MRLCTQILSSQLPAHIHSQTHTYTHAHTHTHTRIQTMTHTQTTHMTHTNHTQGHIPYLHTHTYSALPKLGVLPLVPLKTLEESVTRAKQTILLTSGEMQSPDSLLVRLTDHVSRRTQTTHIETQEPTTDED